MSPIQHINITNAFVGKTEEKINEEHKKINDKMNEIIGSKKEFKTGSQLKVQQEIYIRRIIKDNEDKIKSSDGLKYKRILGENSIIKDVLFVSLALQYGDKEQKEMAIEIYNKTLRTALEKEKIKDLPKIEVSKKEKKLNLEVDPKVVYTKSNENIKVKSVDEIPWKNISDDILKKEIFIDVGGKKQKLFIYQDDDKIYRDGNGIPYYKFNNQLIGLDELIKMGHFNPSEMGVEIISPLNNISKGKDPLLISSDEYKQISIKSLLNAKKTIIPLEVFKAENRERLNGHALRPETIEKADELLLNLSKRGLLTDSVRMKILMSLYEVDYIDSLTYYRYNLSKKYIEGVTNLSNELKDLPNLFARGVDNLKIQIQSNTEKFHNEPYTGPFKNNNIPTIANILNNGLENVINLGRDDIFFSGRKDMLDTFLNMKYRDLVPGKIIQRNLREEQFNLLSEDEYNEVDSLLLSVLGQTYYNNIFNQYIGNVSADVGSERDFQGGEANISSASKNINYETNTRRVKMLIFSALYADKLAKGISRDIGGTEWDVNKADIEGAIAKSFILKKPTNYVSGPGYGGGSLALGGTTNEYVSDYELDANGQRIPKTDKDGNIIYQKDSNGNILVDENGQIVPEYKKLERKTDVELFFLSGNYTARVRNTGEKIYDYIKTLNENERELFLKSIKIDVIKKGVTGTENIKTYTYYDTNSANELMFQYGKDTIELNKLLNSNKDEQIISFDTETINNFEKLGLLKEEIPLDIRTAGGQNYDKMAAGLSTSGIKIGNIAQIDTAQFAYEEEKEILKIISKMGAHVFDEKKGYAGNMLFTLRHHEKSNEKAEDDMWRISELYYMDNKGDVFRLNTVENSIFDYFNGMAFGADSRYAKSEAYMNYQWKTDTYGIVAGIDVGDLINVTAVPTLGYQYEQVTEPEKFRFELKIDEEGNEKTIKKVMSKEDRRKFEEQHTGMGQVPIEDWEVQVATPITFGYYNMKEPVKEGSTKEISRIDYDTYGVTTIVKNENNRIIVGGRGGVSTSKKGTQIINDNVVDETGVTSKDSNIWDFYTMYDYKNKEVKWGTGFAYYTGTAMSNFGTSEEVYEQVSNLKRVLNRSYYGQEFEKHYLGLYMLSALQFGNIPKLDEDGNVVYQKEKDGSLKRDDKGNPIFEKDNTEFFFRLAGIYKWNKESNTGIKFDFSRISGLDATLNEITKINDQIKSPDYNMANLEEDSKKVNENIMRLQDIIWKLQTRVVFDENSSRVTVQFGYNETKEKLENPGVYLLYNHENGFFKAFVQPISAMNTAITDDGKITKNNENLFVLGGGFGFGSAFRLAVNGGAILAADMVTEFKNYETIDNDIGLKKKRYPTRGGFGSLFLGYSQEIVEKAKKIKEIDEITTLISLNKLPENNNTLNTAFTRVREDIEYYLKENKYGNKYSDNIKRIFNGNASLKDLTQPEREFFEQLLSEKLSLDLKEFSQKRLHSFGIGAIYMRTASYDVESFLQITGYNRGDRFTESRPEFSFVPKRTDQYIKNSLEIPFTYSVTNLFDAYIIYRYKWAELNKISTKEHSVALGFEQFSKTFSTFCELAYNYSQTSDKSEKVKIEKRMNEFITTLGLKKKTDKVDFTIAGQGFMGNLSSFGGSLDETYIGSQANKINWGMGILFGLSF